MAYLYAVSAGTRKLGTLHARVLNLATVDNTRAEAYDNRGGISANVGCDGTLYRVDPEELRATLPHNWRKAFDRAGKLRYSVEHGDMTIDLRDAKGLDLAYIRCKLYDFDPDTYAARS